MHGMIMMNRPEQRRDAERDVVVRVECRIAAGGISGQARKGAAVVAGAGAEAVQHFAEARAGRRCSGPPGPRRSATAHAVKPRMLNVRISTASEATFMSYDSIFLPRYSGVRPTINPAMKIAMTMKTSMPYRPAPTPPKMISPSSNVQQRHHSANGREAVVHRVHGAAGSIRCDVGEECGVEHRRSELPCLRNSQRARCQSRPCADCRAPRPTSQCTSPPETQSIIAVNTAQPWP